MMMPMPRLRSHSLLTAMALLAALLLALVPTLGRLYQSAQHAGSHANTIAMCTVDGMKEIVRPPLITDGSPPAHAAPDGERPAHDCDYCPLLTSLLVLSLLPLGLLPLAKLSPRVFWCDAIRINQRHPCGLGSRGPPAFLRTV